MALSVKSYSSIASGLTEIANYSSVDLESYYGSSQFLKSIVPFALASIISRRCAIKKEYLKTHRVASVTYVGFRSTIPSGHCVRFLHAAQRKIQDVVEKKQLKAINLYIQDRASEEIKEVYELALSYLDDGDPSLNDINVTRQMKPKDTRALKVAGDFFTELNRIPDADMYNEKDIKLHFELEFFSSIPKTELEEFEPFDLKYRSSYRVENIASIATVHHRLNIRMKIPKSLASSGTCSLRLSEASPKRPRDPVEDVVEVASTSKSSKTDSYFRDLDDWSSICDLPTQYKAEKYKCYCCVNVAIPPIEGIQCKKCKQFEHVACIGYVSKANIPEPENHLCVFCLIKNKKWNDTILLKRYKTETRRKYFCFTRLFVICIQTKDPQYLIEYLTDSERDMVVAYLKKKKLMCSNGEKPSEEMFDKFFYDRTKGDNIQPILSNSSSI